MRLFEEHGEPLTRCALSGANASPKSRFVGRVEAWLSRLAVESFRHPVTVLVTVAIVTAVSLLAAMRLRLDTDLAKLLPQSFESVQDLKVLKDRYGGEGYLVVIARDADPDALRRFADDTAPRLATLPEVRYVEKLRPTEFLRDHALFFLDLDDLRTVKDRLDARKKWEVLHASPFYVDLLNTKPPSVDFSGIISKYAERWPGIDILRGSRSPYYLDEHRRLIALLVKPTGLASDLEFAQKLVHEVKTALGGMDLKAYGPQMRVQLTGRYKKRVDLQNQLRRDLSVASVAALLSMVAFLAFHFRRKGAVILVFIPLLVGLAWTFGFTWVAFGELNILTTFIGTILMGLGIDHGIHLLSRYEYDCTMLKGCSDAAMARAFSTTGRPVVVAALTTMVAFTVLGFSQFKAFYQFGVIAAVGMVLVVIAYLISLPALLGLALRIGWQPTAVEASSDSPYGRLLAGKAPLILAVFSLLSLAAVVGIPRASFNYDFAALDNVDLPSYRLDRTVNAIIGHSQTPLVVLAPNRETETQYLEALRARKAEYGAESSISFILSLHDLVPAHQMEKQSLIKEIGGLMRWMDLDKLEPQRRQMIEDLIRMTEELPFEEADLPRELVRRFHGVNGKGEEEVILIYPSIRLSRGDLVVKLAGELRDVPVPGGGRIRAAGEAMIFADMLKMVFRESTPILFATVLLVFLAMWGLMGGVRRAFICLIPGALTVAATVGLSSRLGLQFNYINIVAIPVLLGIGVDGGVYLVSEMERRSDINYVVTRTGRAVGAAILTTALGFGSLILAHHPGLKSLGEVAVLGLAINLLSCLVGLASMLAITASMGLRRGRIAVDACPAPTHLIGEPP